MQTLAKLLVEEYNADLSIEHNEDAEFLEELVRRLSFPRHIHINPYQNDEARRMVESVLRTYCDFVEIQGKHKNIVAGWSSSYHRKHVIGGHYDGPPGSPGADDNASAIASLCLLAKKLSKTKPQDVVLVAFNGEEEGLLGSYEFVKTTSPKSGVILEMVGYFVNEEGSQQMPEGLPQYSVGNFLGIVGNRHTGTLGSQLTKLAKKAEIQLPIKNLKIPFGLENRLPGLENTKRSDHFPFWEKQIPAVMLTDTAEFRNANYHRETDTPDTLNYSGMCQVVKLLVEYANQERKML